MLNLFAISAWIFIVLCGACLGSFAAVIIYRLQAGISIVVPRSFCVDCQNPLKIWHNIPIISWLLLRGRCSFCRNPIGLRPLIVELIFAVAMVALYAKYGLSIALVERVLLFFILVILSYIDMDSFSLPVSLLVTLCTVGFLSTAVYALSPTSYVPISQPNSWLAIMVFNNPVTYSVSDRLWGAGVLGGTLSAMNIIATLLFRASHRLTPTQWAMGWGDPVLAMGIGLFVGASHAVLLLFLASASGALMGIIYRLGQTSSSNDQDIAPGAIPYGPFLALAALYIYLT